MLLLISVVVNGWLAVITIVPFGLIARFNCSHIGSSGIIESHLQAVVPYGGSAKTIFTDSASIVGRISKQSPRCNLISLTYNFLKKTHPDGESISCGSYMVNQWPLSCVGTLTLVDKCGCFYTFTTFSALSAYFLAISLSALDIFPYLLSRPALDSCWPWRGGGGHKDPTFCILLGLCLENVFCYHPSIYHLLSFTGIAQSIFGLSVIKTR